MKWTATRMFVATGLMIAGLTGVEKLVALREQYKARKQEDQITKQFDQKAKAQGISLPPENWETTGWIKTEGLSQAQKDLIGERRTALNIHEGPWENFYRAGLKKKQALNDLVFMLFPFGAAIICAVGTQMKSDHDKELQLKIDAAVERRLAKIGHSSSPPTPSAG